MEVLFFQQFIVDLRNVLQTEATFLCGLSSRMGDLVEANELLMSSNAR